MKPIIPDTLDIKVARPLIERLLELRNEGNEFEIARYEGLLGHLIAELVLASSKSFEEQFAQSAAEYEKILQNQIAFSGPLSSLAYMENNLMRRNNYKRLGLGLPQDKAWNDIAIALIEKYMNALEWVRELNQESES